MRDSIVQLFCCIFCLCTCSCGGGIFTRMFSVFRCSCGTGYALGTDGRSCEDIDECLLQQDDCDDNAECTNTDGGYDCTCNDGKASTVIC